MEFHPRELPPQKAWHWRPINPTTAPWLPQLRASADVHSHGSLANLLYHPF